MVNVTELTQLMFTLVSGKMAFRDFGRVVHHSIALLLVNKSTTRKLGKYSGKSFGHKPQQLELGKVILFQKVF